MNECLICTSETTTFLDFGDMPIANGFLTPDQFQDEPFAPLRVAFCPECTMVQLTDLIEPAKMFHQNYAFFSSTSRKMTDHFATFASDIDARWLQGDDPFVVEIGSNDGIMLQNFAKKGTKHLGVEPSGNVAEAARAKGIDTISVFFGANSARAIRKDHGPANAILGANVMCHIPDLHSVLEGVDELLKPHGVLVFEDPYLGDIIEKTSYDQIYDEHAYYFCIGSLTPLLARHGFEIIRAEPQNVHGGSMRYTIGRTREHTADPSVAELREKEAQLGLGEAATYDRFRQAVEDSRDKLVAKLRALRDDGVRVVGYGATSKSTTVLNYCGIGPDLVDAISDTTPIKQGKFSPGMHIPIIPYTSFAEDPPAVALLFAWNHEREIVENEKGWLASGGRFLVYVPDVGYLGAAKAVTASRGA